MGSKAPTQTLVDFAADRMRESILAGRLSPGEWIRLDVIADDLGMSPIPLREALRMLAAEGLVVPLPRRGYIVAPVTISDLEETYRLRLLLEPLAVELAVPLLSPVDVEGLERDLEDMQRAVDDRDWSKYSRCHRSLHFGIYGKCGSVWLLRFVDMLWLNAQRYQRVTMEIAGQLEERNREHRKILDRCRAADAEEAAALMHTHLGRALDSLRGYLAKNADFMAGRDESDSEEPPVPAGS